MRKLWIAAGLTAGALVIPAAPAAAQATCNGHPVTIFGTAGDDTITGTAGPDVIAAEAGNDRVFGLGGNDTVCLGPGNDVFTGAGGNDHAVGGTGNDTVVAGAGVDGSDRFFGQAGVDTADYFNRTGPVSVSLNAATDDGAPGEGDNIHTDVENVSGGAGNDTIIGSNSSNVLDGQAGNDAINGAGGNDLLRGGNDNDTLAGQGGDDFVLGNNGEDTFIAAAGPDDVDVFEGGTGIDTANYSGRTVPLRISLDGAANDGSAGEGDNIRLDVENVIGGSGNDVITANVFQSNRNILTGGAGNDLLDSVDAPFIAHDQLYGGFDVDTCRFDADDSVTGCEIT